MWLVFNTEATVKLTYHTAASADDATRTASEDFAEAFAAQRDWELESGRRCLVEVSREWDFTPSKFGLVCLQNICPQANHPKWERGFLQILGGIEECLCTIL